MARAGGDDREAIDRAFAELVAGYHLTADPPSPREAGTEERSDETDRVGDRVAEEKPRTRDGRPQLDLDSRWAEQHPLFSYTEESPAAPPEPEDDRFEPGPPPPWPRPSAAVLIGWIGVGYAVITMIAAALGAPVPRWAGWMAVGSFVGGFALLLSRLPRNRPPESGDGAVV